MDRLYAYSWHFPCLQYQGLPESLWNNVSQRRDTTLKKNIQIIRNLKRMCDGKFSTSSLKLSFWNNHMLAWSAPSPTMNVKFEWWTHSSRCDKAKSRIDDCDWLHTLWKCVTNGTMETNSPNPVTKVYTQNRSTYRKIRGYLICKRKDPSWSTWNTGGYTFCIIPELHP